MSFPAVPAYVHYGSWDDEMRQHPALNWMELYTKTCIDQRAWTKGVSATEWHTADFTLQKSTGEQFKGAEAGWQQLEQTYAPFANHIHDPQFLVSWETEQGYEMTGSANLWYNLAVPGDSPKVKFQNQDFDGMTPGFFKFSYVKDAEKGFKISRTEIYSDPSAALVLMLKRGMMKPDDLLK